jgi:asparagine synthase (glutamine-hydrolysing)
MLFSGGRDSSALLALALHVARRDGLPDPIALTDIFPGDAAADEAQWQERVIGHLKAPEWIKHDLGSDDSDAVGPAATRAYRRYGAFYPPLAYKHIRYFRVAAGGTVMKGEGGDELFTSKRSAVFRLAVERQGRVSRGHARSALGQVLPARARAHRVRRKGPADSFTWLLPEARAELTRQLVVHECSEPLDWRRAVWREISRRAAIEANRTFERFADDAGAVAASPFLDPRFVASFAHAGGRLGYTGRNAANRSLFSDLLPEEVLTRSTKATFNASVFQHHTRAFARQWTGVGVPLEFVDPERLRAQWQSDSPHACTLLLLQAAWLAQNGSG